MNHPSISLIQTLNLVLCSSWVKINIHGPFPCLHSCCQTEIRVYIHVNTIDAKSARVIWTVMEYFVAINYRPQSTKVAGRNKLSTVDTILKKGLDTITRGPVQCSTSQCASPAVNITFVKLECSISVLSPGMVRNTSQYNAIQYNATTTESLRNLLDR